MVNRPNNEAEDIAESIRYLIRLQPEHGLKILDGQIELNRHSLAKYEDLLRMYDAVAEADLEQENAQVRQDHRLMLSQICDRYRRILESLKQFKLRALSL